MTEDEYVENIGILFTKWFEIVADRKFIEQQIKTFKWGLEKLYEEKKRNPNYSGADDTDGNKGDIQMKTYPAKTTFTGYRIGLKTPNLYVAVPLKMFVGGKCRVTHRGEEKIINLMTKESDRTYPDKVKDGEFYTLGYFLWETK